jgi:hypothetical protein
MIYSEFEDVFLLALVDGADANGRGQCDAFKVVRSVLPEVGDEWVYSAVDRYDQQGYVGLRHSALSGEIILTMSGNARRAADRVKAGEAEQRQKQKIGY